MRLLRQLRLPLVLTAFLSGVICSRAVAAAQPDPPARIGRVSFLEGAVSFRSRGAGGDWASATVNYPVTTGDELWSPAGARAEVHVGSSAVRLGPRTMVDFLDVGDQGTRLRLPQGSLYLRLREVRRGDSYEVATPHGSVSLLGTGHYRIDVSADGHPSTLTVRDGSAEISAAGGAVVSVREGETVSFAGPGSPALRVTTVAVDDWETWCLARDRRDDASLSLHYVSPEWVGFEDLDGYGTWEVDAGFGPVWVPRVEAGWAPYRLGSWAWVAPWGWTWIDDAPWGFAPFHYGRWAFRYGRWAWVPGEIVPYPVYAPALVAFVGGSGLDLSLDYGAGGGFAWFPLAPGEVFLPTYRVSRTYIRDVNVTNVYVRQIDVTKIDVTKVRYANRSVPGAVTAVSKETFLRGGEVSRAAIRVSPSALARATVVGTTAPVTQPRPVERIVPRARPATGADTTWKGPRDSNLRRQWQAEREQVLARQAAESVALERRHLEEMNQAPAGARAEDLRQRQAQERDSLAQRHREETSAIDHRYARERR